MFWFLFLSIVPIAFLAIYSVKKFESAIDYELNQRILSLSREVDAIFNDQLNILDQNRKLLTNNIALKYSMSTQEFENINPFINQLFKKSLVAELNFYNKNGEQVMRFFKNQSNEVQSRKAQKLSQRVFIQDSVLNQLKSIEEISQIKHFERSMTFTGISKIMNSNNKVIGYLEQKLIFNQSFINILKSKIKAEIFILNEKGDIHLSSHKDFYLTKSDHLKKILTYKQDQNLNLKIRDEKYGFMFFENLWNNNKFTYAIGVSKDLTSVALKNINIAYASVVLLIIILTAVVVYFITLYLLQPIYELLDGVKAFQNQQGIITLPVTNDSEIGQLTESFNEMSVKVNLAQVELKEKIKELEKTNLSLKEAQSQLVHSAKMMSLGQLVAGVAHELNNPIGYIYSNMSFLKEYTKSLFDLVDKLITKHPTVDNQQYLEQIEYEFLKKDLPKLISACEDGALRTKEIVLGLRNFSRLDNSKVKEIDVKDSLVNSVELLSAMSGDRVEFIYDFKSENLLNCYASEVNQVFLNILSNAIQAISGHGKIWISTDTVKIDDKSFLSISIQDNGRGISKEYIDKIFDPFFTTKDVGQGTGLGLSISYGIIKKHGGHIEVRSDEGVGTEFLIYIPFEMRKDLIHGQ